MIEITYQDNIQAKILALWRFKTESIPSARRSSLSSVGFYVSDEIRKYIESDGDGSWPESHPLTQLMEKKRGKWVRKENYEGAYHKLAKFARYTINPQATNMVFGFGAFSARDIKRGKQVQFDPLLTKIAQDMQKNRAVAVNEDKRQMFGATRGVLDGDPSDDTPGVEFYPLCKGTGSLHVKARKVDSPIAAKVRAKSGTLFSEKFHAAIYKRYEKL